MNNKQKLIEDVNYLLANASSEELDVVASLLKAAKEKQDGQFRSYISALMKVESNFLEDGDYEVRIPIRPLIHNPLNIVHGGITATLVDIAMGSLVHQSLPEHQTAVTTELKLNYVKPGIGDELICIAKILNKGKSIYVCEAKVYNDKNSLIAIATGSFFIIRSPK
ncbi:PaaI family thioesterase [Anaerobacillus sp. CMMVII]|uniref:PaaI family thioesterase n=1 Tax=Anaerobacillus sp. CMMVII TaxID=2755588 RepID=UPI0021B823D5|nr:PaaI family thioesterase [Anaerobacillus sp. CMMVII]MCT8139054.1 PaaI family thioesterase [Anaerobacillus sp. CMMVII]